MTTPSAVVREPHCYDGILNVFDMASRRALMPMRGEVLLYEYLPWNQINPTIYPTILDLITRTTISTVMPPHWEQNAEPRKGRVLLMSPFARLLRMVEQHLTEAGADCSRIRGHSCLYPSRSAVTAMRLPNHVSRLRDDIVECGADLVVIDPLNELLAYDAGHSEQEMIERVRAALEPIAAETHAAILVGFVRTEEEPPNAACGHRSWPSTDAAAAPAPSSSAVIHRRAETPGSANGSTAVSALAHSDVPRAMEFLQEVLARGSCSSKAVEYRASQRGLKQRTLRTAREQLGVRVWKMASVNGPWMWDLPTTPTHDTSS
ncbi:MAG: AAA family ATPase [Candidatus Kapaibacterium sp.]